MQSITWDDLFDSLDLEELVTRYKQLSYIDVLRQMIDENLVDILMNVNEYFLFRIYFFDEGKWNFYRYGKLTKEGVMVSIGTDAKSLLEESAQTIFSFSPNIPYDLQIRPHDESVNHLVVLIGMQKYLLQSKYFEVVLAALRYFN
jgi:hypothetical protein